VLIAAAVVVVLVVVGVVLGVVLTGGSEDETGGSTSTLPRLPHAAEVQKLLDGIPQRGEVIGEPDAPVTMVEYVDPQCPYCAAWTTSSVPELISRYVRPGKLKIELRALASLGPDSQRGRLAMIAAGRQDKEYNLAHLLYKNAGAENTGWLSDRMVRRAAASIPGLELARFERDLAAPDVADQAARYDRLLQEDNVQVTPTILVGRTGTKLKLVPNQSPYTPEAVVDAIEAALG
jgi:protein-disulfide isomerase